MCIRENCVFVLFCLFALSYDLYSQIVLQGVVTDTGLEPVPNVLVELIDQADSSLKFSDFTNQQGQYEIQIVETGIKESHVQNPGTFSLSQNYPNPFNPSTVIAYELPKPSTIRIDIYNVLGKKIRTLLDGFQTNLTGRIIWDAIDDFGHGMPAGIYIYSLKAGGIRLNKKMLLSDGLQGQTSVTKPHATAAEVSRLSKPMSDQYTLRITGADILTYEQQNLIIAESTELDVKVIRAGTVTDIDGNIYRTVKIGHQWWMAENLKVTHYRNGDEILNVTDGTEWDNQTKGAYCAYDNDENQADISGYLYNGYAVGDSRKIAPAGWHVPTDEEWKVLEMYLGMSQFEADQWGTRGTDEGDKLKEAGPSHWGQRSGGTNESGFSALPGGMMGVSNGPFGLLGYMAFFWSTNGICRVLEDWVPGIDRSGYIQRFGFSVRLVRD